MVLVLVEHDRGALNELSLQALTLGRDLAAATGEPLEAVIAGDAGASLAADAAAHGARTVHVASHEVLADFAPAAWAQAVVDVAGRTRPTVVLAAASDRGAEVMAHVAAKLELPLAANCVEVRPGDPFTLTRLRWGGRRSIAAITSLRRCWLSTASSWLGQSDPSLRVAPITERE